MDRLSFRFERRVRLPGQDWAPWRVEAECRHFGDIAEMIGRRKDRTARQETDCTGRQVQAEYQVTSLRTGGTIKTFIVGV